ncbi:nuclear pore assembly and biogenesis-domain-containing protein [Lophiotrema nucula]|uniref:Nuclear pore assembly and biogenesis-domain-containing protein n=1 Tax=Lophiotrema nucula TaxID=690887 RepID=A0A6A5ZPC5_9PLEO|nr:nuclear pore assembly and biogenesis-domain-containing protein [Lophiotrema nucula]
MEFIQDYLNVLPRFLPPSIYNTLFTTLTTAFGLFRTLQAHLTPLFTRIINQPDITSLLIVAVVLLVSLKILDMAYRAVMFWVNLVVKLVLWGGIAILGVWMWNRGIDGFVDDVQELVEYWMDQYQNFSSEVKGARQQEQVKMQRKGYGYKQPKRSRW